MEDATIRDSATISLTQGQHAIIDAENLEWLQQYNWYALRSHKKFYAVAWHATELGNLFVYMHRLVLGTSKQTDHINGDSLDNRRANLRVCTSRQDSWNQQKQRSRKGRPLTSNFKGVFLDKGRFRAAIFRDGQREYLGYFQNELDAARAYDVAAKRHFGEFAWLNFPEK